jgi:hypothetical protein
MTLAGQARLKRAILQPFGHTSVPMSTPRTDCSLVRVLARA